MRNVPAIQKVASAGLVSLEEVRHLGLFGKKKKHCPKCGLEHDEYHLCPNERSYTEDYCPECGRKKGLFGYHVCDDEY